MIIRAAHLRHAYGRQTALEDVTLEIGQGESVAVIGPDGVGKSTLLGLIAGARKPQKGDLDVFGGDVRSQATRAQLQQRIAYMPQGLGKALYADLTVRENLAFFSCLYGQGREERKQRAETLTRATGLYRFLDRPAGKLSGGMKQKLGLCCALIHDPDLLVLDEPTTGIDPLSRKQFWSLIDALRAGRANLTVIVATSYMEEAEAFGRVLMMNEGGIIADGTPADLLARSGAGNLEQAFISFLPAERRAHHEVPVISPRADGDNPVAISARGLTCRFGDFTAVDHVSFDIRKGEIFGFLGSNGCGKTTTMKMLTGLLTATEGESRLFGVPFSDTDMGNRRRIGYMSQSFSLYSELSVEQNLRMHARLFGLTPEKTQERTDWIYTRFGLARYRHARAATLPLGVRQRLSLAVAVIHEPEVLILDEPTSGVDPVARDSFWALLMELSRRHGVTIFVSTHFMNEAMRCDRISLMDAGCVLATGTPAELQAQKRAATLNDAFIAFLEEAAARDDGDKSLINGATPPSPPRAQKRASLSRYFSPTRMLAYSRREIMELLRDPLRLGIATVGMAFLMIIFGFGITLDVNSLRYAALDLDKTPDSRAYMREIEGSTYFFARPPLSSHRELDERLQDGSISLALEIPPGFGRHLRRGDKIEIGAWVDGSLPYRAETIEGYLEGLHMLFLKKQGLIPDFPLKVETRYLYNQTLRSVNAIVPAVIGLLLVFIPAILSALSVVREKEMGSITNLYVTPVTRAEFILGKQLPYVAFAMIGFSIMMLMALLLFHVSVKGSLAGLCLGAFLYAITTTSLGFLVSSFTRSQVAALFVVAICTMIPAANFSGLLQPVSTLEGAARWIGTFYPTTYFLKTSIGAFTKGLDLAALQPFLMALSAFIPVLLACNIALLEKQER